MLNYIKSLDFCSKFLKIVIFMLGNLLFALSSGNPTPTNELVGKLKVENLYFLDLGSLRPLWERRNFQESMYMEKKDPSIVWIAFPTMSCSGDYYSAVAGVVAAELHRRIDKNAVVPPTRFVIKKSKDDCGYNLLGCVYQEIPFATPIEEMVNSQGFNDYANNTIYKNHNIEQSISAWSQLGLSMAPYCGRLAVSEDNRLIRYDYFEAFQHSNSDIRERCFRTSNFPVNDYRCDVEHIKGLKQEQRERYRTTLKTVIDDIRTAAGLYLAKDQQKDLDSVLEDILANF